MFEGILERALLSFLGNYVSLDREQLHVGVWSGHIALRNLALRPDALHGLNIPVNVRLGVIQDISVTIPWTDLWGSPVRVCMRGVYALGHPAVGVFSDTAAAQAVEYKRSIKQRKIRDAMGTEDTESEGMMETLFKTIVNNLQLEVLDLHVRYEDSLWGNRHSRFAVGFELKSFTAVTTNGAGESEFQSARDCQTLHKVLHLHDAAVYWDFDADWVPDDSMIEHLAAMGAASSYIIHPFSVSLQVTINNDLKDMRIPKFAVTMVLEYFAIQVHRLQYQSVIIVLDRYSKAALKHKIETSFAEIVCEEELDHLDTSCTVQRRWRYALQCVKAVVRSRRRFNFTGEYLAKHNCTRRRYITLYNTKLVWEGTKNKSKVVPECIDQLLAMEDDLAVDLVIIYRHIATLEFEAEAKNRELVKAAKEYEAGAGFWSYLGYTETAGATGKEPASLIDSFELTEEQKSELYHSLDLQSVVSRRILPHDFIRLRFQFVLNKVVLELHDENGTFTELHTDCNVLCRYRVDSSWGLALSVNSLSLRDMSPSAVLPHIVSQQHEALEHSEDGFFKLELDSTVTGDSDCYKTLRCVCQGGLEAVYSGLWVDRSLQFFALEQENSHVESPFYDPMHLKLTAMSWKEDRQAEFLNLLDDPPNMDLDIEVLGLVFVLPDISYPFTGDITTCGAVVGRISGITMRTLDPRTYLDASHPGMFVSPTHTNLGYYEGARLHIQDISLALCDTMHCRVLKEDIVSNFNLLAELLVLQSSALDHTRDGLTKVYLNSSSTPLHLSTDPSSLKVLLRVAKPAARRRPRESDDRQSLSAGTDILEPRASISTWSPIPRNLLELGFFIPTCVLDLRVQQGQVITLCTETLTGKLAMARLETRVRVTLHSLGLQDQHCSLVQSTGEDKDLITVSYNYTHPHSVEYTGVDTDILVDIGSLGVTWVPETIAQVLDFVHTSLEEITIFSASTVEDSGTRLQVQVVALDVSLNSLYTMNVSSIAYDSAGSSTLASVIVQEILSVRDPVSLCNSRVDIHSIDIHSYDKYTEVLDYIQDHVVSVLSLGTEQPSSLTVHIEQVHIPDIASRIDGMTVAPLPCGYSITFDSPSTLVYGMEVEFPQGITLDSPNTLIPVVSIPCLSTRVSGLCISKGRVHIEDLSCTLPTNILELVPASDKDPEDIYVSISRARVRVDDQVLVLVEDAVVASVSGVLHYDGGLGISGILDPAALSGVYNPVTRHALVSTDQQLVLYMSDEIYARVLHAIEVWEPVLSSDTGATEDMTVQLDIAGARILYSYPTVPLCSVFLTTTRVVVRLLDTHTVYLVEMEGIQVFDEFASESLVLECTTPTRVEVDRSYVPTQVMFTNSIDLGTVILHWNSRVSIRLMEALFRWDEPLEQFNPEEATEAVYMTSGFTIGSMLVKVWDSLDIVYDDAAVLQGTDMRVDISQLYHSLGTRVSVCSNTTSVLITGMQLPILCTPVLQVSYTAHRYDIHDRGYDSVLDICLPSGCTLAYLTQPLNYTIDMFYRCLLDGIFPPFDPYAVLLEEEPYTPFMLMTVSIPVLDGYIPDTDINLSMSSIEARNTRACPQNFTYSLVLEHGSMLQSSSPVKVEVVKPEYGIPASHEDDVYMAVIVSLPEGLHLNPSVTSMTRVLYDMLEPGIYPVAELTPRQLVVKVETPTLVYTSATLLTTKLAYVYSSEFTRVDLSITCLESVEFGTASDMVLEVILPTGPQSELISLTLGSCNACLLPSHLLVLQEYLASPSTPLLKSREVLVEVPSLTLAVVQPPTARVAVSGGLTLVVHSDPCSNTTYHMVFNEVYAACMGANQVLLRDQIQRFLLSPTSFSVDYDMGPAAQRVSAVIDDVDVTLSYEHLRVLCSIYHAYRGQPVQEDEVSSTLWTMDGDELAAPSTLPELPAAISKVTCNLTAGVFLFTLVDDCRGRDSPLLQLVLRDCKPTIIGEPNRVSVVLTSVLGVSFYNPKVVVWEPLVEPCRVQTVYVQEFAPSKRSVLFKVSGVDDLPSQGLEVTLSHACVSTVLDTRAEWLRNWEVEYSPEEHRQTPYYLENLTEYRLSLSYTVPSGHTHASVLDPGQTLALSAQEFHMDVALDGAVLRDIPVGSIGKTLHLLGNDTLLVIECGLRHHSKYVSIGSCFSIENDTSEDLDVRVSLDPMPRDDEVYTVRVSPGTSVSVPVRVAHYGYLCFRPVLPGYEYCEVLHRLIEITAGDSSHQPTTSMTDGEDPPSASSKSGSTALRTASTAYRSQCGHGTLPAYVYSTCFQYLFQHRCIKLRVSCTTRLYNLLPVTLEYSLDPSSSSILVPAGDTVDLPTVDGARAVLAMAVLPFGLCKGVALRKGTHPVELTDDYGRGVTLCVEVREEHHRRHVRVYAPVWVVNTTGLSLEVGVGRRGAAPTPVAGQYSAVRLQVCELHRCSVVQWKPPFLPSDPAPYVTPANTPCSAPHSIELPAHWHWLESGWDVSVDPSTTDPEGWQYAREFAGPYTAQYLRGVHHVRRRVWVRTRAPDRVRDPRVVLCGGGTSALSLKHRGGAYGPRIDLRGTGGSLQLGAGGPDLGISVAPGPWPLTTVVSVAPRFVLVNQTVPLAVLEQGSAAAHPQHVGAGRCAPVYFSGAARLLRVALADDGVSMSPWSGCFSVEPGAPLFLQCADTVLRVATHLIGQTLYACISEADPRTPAYRVENRTGAALSYRQRQRTRRPEPFRVHRLGAGQAAAFVWDDVSQPKPLELEVFVRADASDRVPVPLDQIGLDRELAPGLRAFLYVDGLTRILRLAPGSAPKPSLFLDFAADDQHPSAAAGQLTVQVVVPRIGVSVVDARPRELVYVSIAGVSLLLEAWSVFRRVNFKVHRLQVDNCDPAAAFPVALATSRLDRAHALTPFLEVRARDSNCNPHVWYFKVFALLVQEFDLFLDDTSLRQAASVLQGGGLWGAAASAPYTPELDLVLPELPTDGATKPMFFEELQLYPVKLRLSYRAGRSGAVSDVAKSVSGAPLSFTGKRLERPLVSRAHLYATLAQHYRVQLGSAVASVIGSAEILGNPVGLLHNLGTGVQDFFSEPVEGFLEGPAQFVVGVARGSHSLVAHSVHGVGTSLAGVTSALGKGLAALSFDERFQRARDAQTRPASAAQGAVAAGRTLGAGVLRGLSGVVLDPVRGAQRSGPRGFLKGLARGVGGVVTKPLGGVLDGTTALLQGIGNSAVPQWQAARAREPRMLYGVHRVVRPYDAEHARVRAVLLRARVPDAEAFHFHMTGAFPADTLVVALGSRLLHLHLRSLKVLWAHPYQDLLRVSVDQHRVRVLPRSGDELVIRAPDPGTAAQWARLLRDLSTTI